LEKMIATHASSLRNRKERQTGTIRKQTKWGGPTGMCGEKGSDTEGRVCGEKEGPGIEWKPPKSESKTARTPSLSRGGGTTDGRN